MDWQVLGIILGMSLIPPLLFALWIRNHERYDREPMIAVLRAFAFGGTVGVAVAFVLNTLFDTAATTFAAGAGFSSITLTAIFAAPLIEEATKGLGLTTQRRQMTEPEDGLVYGAAIGLGFAATENLLYGVTALLDGGVDVAVATVALRILSSTILHAGASALFGFGFCLVFLRMRPMSTIFLAYGVAAALHATYNFLAIMDAVIAVVAAVVLAWAIFGAVRRRIVALDMQGH